MNKNRNRVLKIYFFISLVFLLSLMGMSRGYAQAAKTYEEAIQKGNSELKKGKLFDAKAYFEMALRMKPGDKTAQHLIDETVIKIKNKESRKAGYYNLIDQGDEYLSKGDLDLAEISYQKALKIVPGDAYAEKQIKEIALKKRLEKQKETAFHSKIEEGTHLLGLQEFDKAINLFEEAQKLFPKREMVVKRIALAKRLKAEFQHRKVLAAEEIKTAQRYLLIQNYSTALTHFKKADSLTPGNRILIAKINQIVPLAARQQAYNVKANEADRLYMAKNFMAAKIMYQEAEKLWPGNPYPTDMIDRIDAVLEVQKAHLNQNYITAIHQADSLLHIHELDNAKAQYNLALNLKPGKSYPKEQLKKIAITQKKELAIQAAHYKELIQQADILFARKQFDSSRNLFTEALTIRPNDPYPQKKLQEIEKALLRQAAQAKEEAQYHELVASGNQFFDSHDWELSIQKFQMALRLKPAEVYPKTKIATIRKILADSAKQRKIDEQFTQQIQLGSELRNAKQWTDAKKAYAKAQSLKPSNPVPGRAIAAIDSILQQIANQKKIDFAYRKAFSRGDSLLAIKSYQPALKAFQEAASLKPSETDPKQKIQVINQALAAIARQKQIDETYAKTIQKADSLLSGKDYESALTDYKTALKLKQNENYPKEKIGEINAILQRLAKERELLYKKTISAADASFQAKDFQDALSEYKKALNIKPDASYPQDKIQLCQQLLAATLQKRKMQYNQIIATADKFYQEKAFDEAIDAYKKAHHLMMDEKYPLEMILKITRYISENAIEDAVNKKVFVASNKTMKFPFKPLPVTVRESNYVLIRATNISGTTFNVIFTFGEGNSKNGGFVIRIPKEKGNYNFIIRIGARYQWFSENNDWFSVFAENNPIQIDLIRISKSD